MYKYHLRNSLDPDEAAHLHVGPDMGQNLYAKVIGRDQESPLAGKVKKIRNEGLQIRAIFGKQFSFFFIQNMLWVHKRTVSMRWFF